MLAPVQPGRHVEVYRVRATSPGALSINHGIPYSNETAPPGSVAQIKVGQTAIASYDAKAPDAAAKAASFSKALGDALKTAGYPATADPARINHAMVIVLLVILVIYVTLVYGPIAAMLVELFPTRIRYTSVSLPYHIGNGWFGGFLPTVAFVDRGGRPATYTMGLWYPIAIAAMTLVIGVLFLRETKDVDIRARADRRGQSARLRIGLSRACEGRLAFRPLASTERAARITAAAASGRGRARRTGARGNAAPPGGRRGRLLAMMRWPVSAHALLLWRCAPSARNMAECSAG